MSELTTCCFCELKEMKRKAKEKRYKVTLVKSNFMNGIEVFIHPKDIKKPKRFEHRSDSNESFDKYWVAWLGGLSDGCCC